MPSYSTIVSESTWAIVDSIEVDIAWPVPMPFCTSSPSRSVEATTIAEKPSAWATAIAAALSRIASRFTSSGESSSGATGTPPARLRKARPEPAPMVGANAGRCPHGGPTP